MRLCNRYKITNNTWQGYVAGNQTFDDELGKIDVAERAPRRHLVLKYLRSILLSLNFFEFCAGRINGRQQFGLHFLIVRIVVQHVME